MSPPSKIEELSERIGDRWGLDEYAAEEIARMVLRAYATGQEMVKVGGCGADSEIHRLDYGVFPWEEFPRPSERP